MTALTSRLFVPTAYTTRKAAQAPGHISLSGIGSVLAYRLGLKKGGLAASSKRQFNQAFSSTSMGPAVDKSSVQKDWEQRGFSFGVFVDPPGRVWPDFTHTVDELVMLYEGEMELTVSGKPIKPGVGEEILIPARALHTVENTGSKSNQWLYGYRRK